MANTHNAAVTRLPRPLEELNLIDNFLFQEMMMYEEGEEACKIILSTILGRPIHKVRIIPQKSVPGINTDRHGIRMDAYIEEISDETDASIKPDIYDIEPNKTYEKNSLPKRMRYYHALIDTKLLETGMNYQYLQNVIIIVILPYDPFGKNRMLYTVQNQCVEDTSIPYNDGAKKIFLYTKGCEGNPSQELCDMLKYIEKTTKENVTNNNIETLHRLVCSVKGRTEVGISYMKSWEYEQMCREEAMAEGLAEGLEKGLEQGLEQGRQALAASELSAIKNLMLKLKMTAEQAMDTLEIAADKRRQYSDMISSK